MMLTDIANSSFVVHLVDFAIRALVLAGAAGLGLVLFRVKATSARLFTWTAILYASLAMPILAWMLPPLPVPAPGFLAQKAQERAETPQVSVSASTAPVAPLVLGNEGIKKKLSLAIATESSQHRPTHIESIRRSDSWRTRAFAWLSVRWATAAISLYLTIASLLLIRLIVGLVLSHRLIEGSQVIYDTRVAETLASHAQASALLVIPRIAESRFTTVPVTVGTLRSTILLPTSWQGWDHAKLNAVIAHEVSHIARGDGLTQCLAQLNRAIFWFSPLAWWLGQHLTDLAEQASDEAALACGADRTDYAKTLLGFFEALQAAPGRVWWQGVSMAKAGQAEERVKRILAWKGAVSVSLKKSFAVVIVALAIPVVYLTAAVRPAYDPSQAGEFGQDQAAPSPQTAPTAPVLAPPSPETPPPSSDAAPAIAPAGGVDAPPPPGAAIAGVVSNHGYRLIRPAIPTAPIAPIQPAFAARAWAAQSGTSTFNHGHGFHYAFGFDDEQRFVIVTGKTDSLTMSGTSEDARHVEKLRKHISGDFIWFQRDEKSYIIRDQATIDRARAFWAPQEELGRKQEELGKQQEALGKQQEELGAKMEQVQVKVPDMTAALDKLKAKLQKLGPTASMEQIGELQSEIGELQSKMGEIQSQAGDQQGKLGEEMGALGEKQGKLGEQQGELGRQQGELAEKAERQMKELFDEAIKKGTAQPEPDSSL